MTDADAPRNSRSIPGHISFGAEDLARAAVEAGGTDAGALGLRAHYSPSYYAAFVIDPDGYKLEAVHQ